MHPAVHRSEWSNPDFPVVLESGSDSAVVSHGGSVKILYGRVGSDKNAIEKLFYKKKKNVGLSYREFIVAPSVPVIFSSGFSSSGRLYFTSVFPRF